MKWRNYKIKRPMELPNVFIWTAIAGLLVFLSPTLYAHALLNYAQRHRIQGDILPSMYIKVLGYVPDDTHVRWQVGEALIEAERFNESVAILAPFSHQPILYPKENKLLVIALISTNRYDEALQLYQKLTPQPILPPAIAMKLSCSLFSSNKQTPSKTAIDLMVNGFGLNKALPEFHRLNEEIISPNFWETDLGISIQSALYWRCRQPKQQTTIETNDYQTIISSHIATLIGTTTEEVKLGSELINNGGIEQYSLNGDGIPSWIPWFYASGKPWNLAIFVSGIDQTNVYSGRNSLRIDGLYMEHRPEVEPARAGFHPIKVTLKESTPYCISFVYRTQNVQEMSAAFWIPIEPYNNSYRFLPPTENRWKRASIVFWNTKQETKNIPFSFLLASFSEGNVWFDDVSLREIVSPSLTEPLPDILIQIDDAPMQNNEQ